MLQGHAGAVPIKVTQDARLQWLRQLCGEIASAGAARTWVVHHPSTAEFCSGCALHQAACKLELRFRHDCCRGMQVQCP